MIKSALFIFALCVAHLSIAQTSPEFNLDFEKVQNGTPDFWYNPEVKGYTMGADSIVKRSGKYSAMIASTDNDPDYTAWSFILPHNYKGKQITFSGYIKTENVENGYAGLWMRIDPGIAFDNMRQKELKGTTDWTKYEITLNMDPKRTEKIVIGGLLAGSGKIWLDDLTVTVDGKDVQNMKPFVQKKLPAELDTEFDDGSNIADFPVNKEQIENLKILGYLWGYLKYYHPEVATGNYNWDYELFRILPEVIEAKSNDERDQVFLKWIDGIGTFSKGKKAKMKASKVKMKPDLDWIEQSNFPEELTEKLVEIQTAKRSSENYYVRLFPGVENPNLEKENPYHKFDYPDAGYRLLSLYRYWNIIQYYFPYKYLIEENWNDVLGEFIPKFLEAKDETAYTLACLEVIGRVHDTHANIWGGNTTLYNYWGNYYPPFEVTFIEEKAVVTDYYDEELTKESGIQIGDVIESINGKLVDEMVKEQLHLTPASSYPIKLRNIAHRLLNTNDSIIHVQYSRGDEFVSTSFPSSTAYDLKAFGNYEKKDTCFKFINEDIAYINNGTLQNSYLPEIWEKMKNTKGLVIDIRNYPSGFPIYALSEYLMPKKTKFVTFTNASIKHPGYFTFNEVLSVGKKNKDYYKGKVIILTNETSQSSAEFHAMAYRVHPNATVIGSTTAGADGNISRFYLPGGISTLITGIGVYYPDRGETQRVGIVPDIEYTPTIQGIREGRDELLEKAIEVIMKP